MKTPDFFGLDIGHGIARIVESKRKDNDKAELLNLSSISVNEDILEDASEIAMKSLAEQLKDLKDSAGISTKNCVLGIPEAPIFSRLVTLPVVTDAELDEAVSWELKPLIPVDISEVDIAFIEVAEKDQNGQKFVDIFAVAAPKTLTERYKQLAELSGFNLLAIETKSLSVTRAVDFNYRQSDRDVMIFRFDDLTTDLVLAQQGVPVFTQSVSTGASALTKAIAADYGIDEKQAQQYRDSFGLDSSKGEGKIANSLEPIMQILVNEVNRTLTYFREKLGDTGATEIYICGEAANLPGLPGFLKEQVGMNAQIVDPTVRMNLSDKARRELEQLNASAFTTAVGLSIKDK